MEKGREGSGRKKSPRKAIITIACALSGAALIGFLSVTVAYPAYVRWVMDHIDSQYPAVRAYTRKVRPATSIKMASVRDISVEGPSGSVPIKAYAPEKIRADAPDILYMHGGGFVIGSPAMVDRFCRSLARDCACRVYSVDYRLAPEYPYPAAVEECYAMLGWLRAQAGPVSASGERKIVAAGDSAGANLAAAIALMGRDRGAPELAGQILVCPPVGGAKGEAGAPLASRRKNSKSILTPKSIKHFERMYLGDPDKYRDDPYAHPIRAASLSGLPPALVFTCGRDTLREEGQAYAKRLSEAGVAVTLKDFPDKDHDYQGPETVAAAALFMAGL
jgi:acetyl esterase